MKKKYFIFLIVGVSLIFFTMVDKSKTAQIAKTDGLKRTSHFAAAAEWKRARQEYIHRLLRDPATNRIPSNAEAMDQIFAKKYSVKFLAKRNSAGGFKYKEAGPKDVGGRTRALAVDRRNSNIIIAGGVSGGIWKSTDKGKSWSLKTLKTQSKSVSCIIQDPRAGKEDIWYYGAGEYSGNSAAAIGAPFYGTGLFKSTDNGETWKKIISANSPYKWGDAWSYISEVEINPATGSLFIATNSFGIYKLKEGANKSYVKILGGATNENAWVDIDAAPNGKLIAVLGGNDFGYSATVDRGVYISTNDGDKWTKFPVKNLAENFNRCLVRFAPSNPDIAYLFVYHKNISNNAKCQFFKLNLAKNTSEERTENIPDFSSQYGKFAKFNAQMGYNFVLEVKPDDENMVFIGGISLFRSADGFASKPDENSAEKYWIGGYDISQMPAIYPNSHPDIHALVFDPDNPNKAWCGHDGGLSYSEDIATVSLKKHEWINKNNSYNVTQFFTFALAPGADDNRMVGGTQDNGSPWFSFDGVTTSKSIDISTSDGASCYWGKEDVFVSLMGGRVYRLGLKLNGNKPPEIFTEGGRDWDCITPNTSDNKHFITTYTVDPQDESFVYFLSYKEFWRNNDVRNIAGPSANQWPTLENWTKVMNITSGIFSAVASSNKNSSHVVYLGISGSYPRIVRFDSSKTSLAPASDVSINSAAAGAYINEIAVNPENSKEIIVVLSNYKIKSLFHSTDGGETFKSISGKLGASDGPSVRTAEIVVTEKGTHYLVGTSIGVYSTTNLEGDNTQWIQSSPNEIGNNVITAITSRTSDDRVAVATHGRGAFIGTYDPNFVGIDNKENTPKGFALAQNYPNPFNPSTTIKYSLTEESDVILEIFNVQGQRIKKLVDENQKAGEHQIVWNGTNSDGNKVASGVYFYRIKAGNFVQTKKMNLLK